MPCLTPQPARPPRPLERLLFLDVDGVLIADQGRHFTPACVTQLKRLCREVPDLKFVLSSAWRLSEYCLQKLESEFREHQLDPVLILGQTPDLSQRRTRKQGRLRGREIRTWLLSRGHHQRNSVHYLPIRYAIIDDQCDEIIGCLPRESIFATLPDQGLTAAITDDLIIYFRAGLRADR